MKIATYHRVLGDNVTFFKGDLKDLAFRHILEDCIEQLKKNDSIVNWYKHYDYIREYILKRDEGLFDEQAFVENKNKAIINNTLKYYRKYYCEKTYYQNPRFDRVYEITKQDRKFVYFGSRFINEFNHTNGLDMFAAVCATYSANTPVCVSNPDKSFRCSWTRTSLQVALAGYFTS
mgnify:CR=1 FL=1